MLAIGDINVVNAMSNLFKKYLRVGIFSKKVKKLID